MYTFEVQWPAPFKQGWQRSGQRLATIEEAAQEMAKFLATAFENDCQLEARLTKVE